MMMIQKMIRMMYWYDDSFLSDIDVDYVDVDKNFFVALLTFFLDPIMLLNLLPLLMYCCWRITATPIDL